jgi:hypothetical protein
MGSYKELKMTLELKEKDGSRSTILICNIYFTKIFEAGFWRFTLGGPKV